MTLTTLCPANVSQLLDDGQPSDNLQAYELKFHQGGDFYAVVEIVEFEVTGSDGDYWTAPVANVSIRVQLMAFMVYLAEWNEFVRTYCPPALEDALCEWAEFEIGNKI